MSLALGLLHQSHQNLLYRKSNQKNLKFRLVLLWSIPLV
jgi:hypothetical protein